MKLSIIIPVYNEENSLEEIVDKVVAANCLDLEKEIIISNDGSTDDTFDSYSKTQNEISRNNHLSLTHKPG